MPPRIPAFNWIVFVSCFVCCFFCFFCECVCGVVNVIFHFTPEHPLTTRYFRSPKEKLWTFVKVGLRLLSSCRCNGTSRNRMWLFLLCGRGHTELQTRTLTSMRTQPWFSPRRSDCMKQQIRGLAPIIMCVLPVDYGFLFKK